MPVTGEEDPAGGPTDDRQGDTGQSDVSERHTRAWEPRQTSEDLDGLRETIPAASLGVWCTRPRHCLGSGRHGNAAQS